MIPEALNANFGRARRDAHKAFVHKENASCFCLRIGLIIPHFRLRFNEDGDTNFRLTRGVYFCKIHIDYKHKKCKYFNSKP